MSKYLVKGNEIFNGIIPRYETANTYSTTEQRIGTWINDKSIYRRVFNIGNVSPSATSVLGSISNLDAVISMFGACNSNGLWLPIPRTHVSDVIFQNYVYIDNGSVKIGCGSGSAISYGYLIIEYTKTTD